MGIGLFLSYAIRRTVITPRVNLSRTLQCQRFAEEPHSKVRLVGLTLASDSPSSAVFH